MKATTKFRIHNWLITPVVLLVWLVCLIPLCIAAPFEWLADNFMNYVVNRKIRLMKKYNLGVYEVNGENVLMENEK